MADEQKIRRGTIKVSTGSLNEELAKLNGAFQTFQFGNKPTPEESAATVDFLKRVADGTAQEYYGIEEYQKLLAGADAYKNSPGMQQALQDSMSAKNADRFTRRYKPFFNLLQQGVDIGSAVSQINTAREASKRLVRPTIPKPSGIDPALNQEIRNAQAATFDSARALAPAQQEIASAYNQSDVVDKAISGGQSAVYGARRQKAAVERMRAGLALPGMADDIKRKEQARLSQLIGMRQQAAGQQDQMRLFGSRLETDQYNSDVTAIGALGSQGHLNRRNAMIGLPENLLGAAGRFMSPPATNPYAGQPQVPYTDPYTQTGTKYQMYNKANEEALVNNVNIARAQRQGVGNGPLPFDQFTSPGSYNPLNYSYNYSQD